MAQPHQVAPPRRRAALLYPTLHLLCTALRSPTLCVCVCVCLWCVCFVCVCVCVCVCGVCVCVCA